MDQKLTHAEDADLRRLEVLSRYGQLAPSAAARYQELRARDRRTEVREPADLVVPAQRQPVDGPLVTVD